MLEIHVVGCCMLGLVTVVQGKLSWFIPIVRVEVIWERAPIVYMRLGSV